MYLRATGLALLSLFVASLATAGPVERELRERGTDVAVPESVPTTDLPALSNEPIANPLDPEKPPLLATPDRRPTTTDRAAGQPVVPATASEPAPSDAGPSANQSASASSCLAELQTVADASAAAQPKASDAACRIPEPVTLKSTNGTHPVNFVDDLTLDCGFALRVARFVRDTAQPLARHHVGKALTSVGSGEGFVCRRRNGAKTGKLSEHAYGNAIDIVSFTFGGEERLDVRDPVTMKDDRAAYFKAVRTAACGSFTTVLGPGSNAAHDTHLHFDYARAKGKKNPYRICE